jgi:hypothetical protein
MNESKLRGKGRFQGRFHMDAVDCGGAMQDVRLRLLQATQSNLGYTGLTRGSESVHPWKEQTQRMGPVELARRYSRNPYQIFA